MHATSQGRPQFPPQCVPTNFFRPFQPKTQVPATPMGNLGQSHGTSYDTANERNDASIYLNMLGISDIRIPAIHVANYIFLCVGLLLTSANQCYSLRTFVYLKEHS